MIAEVIPETYDAVGRQVSSPFHHRKGPRPTFPMGRYVSQPLTVKCSTIADIRRFLAGCRYVSDQELFGKRDYWQPPEEFEKRKKGDCDDFALWTWRQLIAIGYDSRFIGGAAGRYGDGHAWVEYLQHGKWYLLEPLRAAISETMPRLSTIRYEPKLSVSWDGKTLRYFAHQKRNVSLGWRQLAPLIWEYVRFWVWFWLKNFWRVPLVPWRMLRRLASRRELWHTQRRPEL